MSLLQKERCWRAPKNLQINIHQDTGSISFRKSDNYIVSELTNDYAGMYMVLCSHYRLQDYLPYLFNSYQSFVSI